MSNNDERAPKKAGRSGSDHNAAQDRQRVVGERLRRLFDNVVHEPVPDEFLKLLEQADQDEDGEDADEGADDNPGAEASERD